MASQPPTDAEALDKPRRRKRRSTSHLKLVPESLEQREQLREQIRLVAAQLDKSQPPDKAELEQLSRRLLEQVGLSEGYVGWTMVMLTTEFWRDQVAATPPERRLFLLPHCLKHAEGCPADYDEFGLDCRQCGACSIADFRTEAEDKGYKVLVAEGSPIVMKIIVSGYVDAIVGVACLNVLEKAIDKILLAGIPCMAVPLLSSDCRNTSVDEAWVSDMIRVENLSSVESTRSYVHLLRAAKQIFDPASESSLAADSETNLNNGADSRASDSELERLLPRRRKADANSPLAATESLAYEFLAKGGKYARPFITLAAYDAIRGGQSTTGDGAQHASEIPDAVRRVALSIETFHKASLIHDDIQDDDPHRYGVETLHRTHGVPTAINVGDYLIGLGYRMVAADARELGPETAADILEKLSESHTRLSEGQGAELMWRDGQDKHLTPLDALKIYALKTSPAFEAALYCGLRAAGPADELSGPVREFSKHIGIAFQILNDLKDWRGDGDNKLTAGGDVLGGRPTLLLALALDALPEDEQAELLSLAQNDQEATLHDSAIIERTRQLYQEAGVFKRAEQMVDKHQERAERIADELASEDLRRLAYYLIDSLLERPEEPTPVLVPLAAPATT